MLFSEPVEMVLICGKNGWLKMHKENHFRELSSAVMKWFKTTVVDLIIESNPDLFFFLKAGSGSHQHHPKPLDTHPSKNLLTFSTKKSSSSLHNGWIAGYWSGFFEVCIRIQSTLYRIRICEGVWSDSIFVYQDIQFWVYASCLSVNTLGQHMNILFNLGIFPYFINI